MPSYKVHITGAALLAAGALTALYTLGPYHLPPLHAAALTATCILASLFPDVDTSSKGRPVFYALLAGLDLVLIINQHYKWAAIAGLVAMLPALGNHRGWTHTWLAMLLAPLAVMALPLIFFQFSWLDILPYFIAAVLGYFSHLALDRTF